MGIDASLSEAAWWDKYGEINERIWHYDDYLHGVVRQDYLDEMVDFLYKPDGRLLDFGCGGGWVTVPLATKGMVVEGIDVSQEQIERAEEKVRQLGLSNAVYFCGDETFIPTREPYDSIVAHSLLHHLSDQAKRDLLQILAEALVEGGRLYLYEPMAAVEQRPWYGWLFDKLMGVPFRALRWFALAFHLYEPDIELLEQANWRMVSPDEAPILHEDLLGFLPPDLVLIKSTYWHAYAIRYANFCMSLKPQWRQYFSPFISVFYAWDRFVLQAPVRNYLRSWPMASFLLQKLS